MSSKVQNLEKIVFFTPFLPKNTIKNKKGIEIKYIYGIILLETIGGFVYE